MKSCLKLLTVLKPWTNEENISREWSLECFVATHFENLERGSKGMAITVAYTMKRMIKNHALFRQFSTCVQHASATVICIDTNEFLTLTKQKKFKF